MQCAVASFHWTNVLLYRCVVLSHQAIKSCCHIDVSSQCIVPSYHRVLLSNWCVVPSDWCVVPSYFVWWCALCRHVVPSYCAVLLCHNALREFVHPFVIMSCAILLSISRLFVDSTAKGWHSGRTRQQKGWHNEGRDNNKWRHKTSDDTMAGRDGMTQWTIVILEHHRMGRGKSKAFSGPLVKKPPWSILGAFINAKKSPTEDALFFRGTLY